MQSIRHFVVTAAYDTRSFFSLTATRLLWGIGVFAVLLPAAAYAWWRQEPVASSVTTSSENTIDMIPETVQPSTEKIDTDPHADMEVPPASSDGTPYAPPVDSTVNTQVYINGQEIPVPTEGMVHKEISNQNGKTSVDISIQSSSSGTSSSHSSTNIEMNSNMTSEGMDMD